MARPRRIAITGYGGFVGSWLRKRIEEKGQDVAVPLLSRGSGDVRDRTAVEQAVEDARPDVVIHLAAIAAPVQAQDSPAEAWAVNVIGTLNLATALRRHAPQAKLVHVGSSEAYGGSFLANALPISEEAPLDPRGTYGATKAAADLMIGQMAHEGLRAVRLRPFNHSGPGQTTEFVVSAFAHQIALIERGAQPPLIKVGNLEAERDFLDVRDVVDAYLAAAGEHVAGDGTAINIATGRPVRVAALLEALLNRAKCRIEVERDPDRFRENTIPVASGSPERAATLLGWRPSTELAATLQDTLDFWRQHA